MNINARSSPVVSFFIGIAVLMALIGINYWVFRYFCVSDPRWYLNNAAAIGIGSAFLSTVWGALDSHPSLVSAHPLKYVGTYLQLLGTATFALGTGFKGGAGSFFDVIVGALLTTIVVAIFALGVLVVAPLQYFVFLVCGAPARLALASDLRVIGREDDTQVDIKEVDAREDIPAGWQDVSFKNKPFTLTNVIVGLLAAALKLSGYDVWLDIFSSPAAGCY